MIFTMNKFMEHFNKKTCKRQIKNEMKPMISCLLSGQVKVVVLIVGLIVYKKSLYVPELYELFKT